MMGMEKLLGQMIGMTPAEMAAKAKEFEGFIEKLSNGMVSIAENQKKILELLEAQNGRAK